MPAAVDKHDRKASSVPLLQVLPVGRDEPSAWAAACWAKGIGTPDGP